ncbi:MAG: MFS transporter, partial [Candidatus Geothermincolia bacterium]
MADQPAEKQASGGMFTSLKHRDFSVLVFFGLPGLIGSVALTTSIFWVIKLVNGPNIWVGAINLARFLPPFFIVFLAGFMADRLDRRKIIVICELATAA